MNSVVLSVDDLAYGTPLAIHWDDLATKTFGIDQWCSQLPWQRSVDTAFGHRFTEEEPEEGFDDSNGVERAESVVANDVIQIEEQWAFAFRQRSLTDGTQALLPLDSVWAFASPFVIARTTSIATNASEATQSLLSTPGWRVAFVTGLQQESVTFKVVAESFYRFARVVEGESTVRCAASLEAGFDAYLSRRPRSFRRNLRAAQRLAEREGIVFQTADVDRPTQTMQRLQSIEHQSWKGLLESGIVAPDMAALYQLLIRDLHTSHGLRVCFAQRDGVDIGFIVGGVLGATYRGLQLSFVEEARAISVGNLLQAHEIERLCNEGVERYDLGMDMPYKRLWSDGLMTTTPMVVLR